MHALFRSLTLYSKYTIIFKLYNIFWIKWDAAGIVANPLIKVL